MTSGVWTYLCVIGGLFGSALLACSADEAPRIDVAVVSTEPRDFADSAERLDATPAIPTGFSCADGPGLALRFLGPETVQLSMAGRDSVLQQERTASGARYGSEGVAFRNKGDEATLETPGGNYRCSRVAPQQ